MRKQKIGKALREKLQKIFIIRIIKELGGMATSSQIRKKAKESGFDSKVRTTLRQLKQEGILKYDRPKSPASAEMRWEIIEDVSK